MIQAQPQTVVLPTTFVEFLRFEPTDGRKCEWNDSELTIFGGLQIAMKKKHLPLIQRLNRLFLKTAAHAVGGELICEQDVMLTGIQVRRPDLAYFSDKQIHSEDEPIPAFCVEVISPTDEGEKIEAKRIEYFKAGIQVLWHILYVYTGRKTVQICSDDDICSAQPALDDFQISVNDLLA